jgi:geranylgeranyl diphosphate synthase, type II
MKLNDDNTSVAPQILREYGDLTRAALKEYLPSQEPRRYLYDLITDYPQRGGKMMRPSLCIATARAFGARAVDALRTAAAIELLHNALLIHDDIEDESLTRRGAPTLHMSHGVPLALNAGDAMTLLCLKPLLENRNSIGDWLALRIIEETERMGRECAEGQAIELGWRRDNITDLCDADYLAMVLKKTCWLATIFPIRVGILLGSRGAVDPDPFMRFGFFLGAAFQIQDDLLNLSPDERYGKEPDGDLWEGKRTLMIIRALHESTLEEQDRLSRILQLARGERTFEQVNWMRALINKYGCVEYTRQVAQGLAGAALHEYSLVFAQLPDGRDKMFLKEMTRWVIQRT